MFWAGFLSGGSPALVSFGANPTRGQGSASNLPSLIERMTKGKCILLAEDNGADVFLIREAIAAARVPAEIHVVNDGEAAVRFIDQTEADESAFGPALFLLDLNLPRKSGAEVLQHLRQTRRYASVPVIIVTSSNSDEDRMQAAHLSANAYFHKPASYAAYLTLANLVKSALESVVD